MVRAVRLEIVYAMANIGEAARRPVDDDNNNVTGLTGTAAGQDAKHQRGTAQALPVCADWALGCLMESHADVVYYCVVKRLLN
jgi:hypothetical protein